MKNYKNPPASDDESEQKPDQGQRLGFTEQNGVSRDPNMSSSDESEPEEPSQMSLLSQGPSWSFGAMTVPNRPSDDDDKAAGGGDDLFGDDDSNVAVGSENGDRMEGLRSGATSDQDVSFEDVPPLQNDASDDELPVMELRVDENDKMTDV